MLAGTNFVQIFLCICECCVPVGVTFVCGYEVQWVSVCICVFVVYVCSLFVCNLNRGTKRFARGKLVYWSLNRVNEERSQPGGMEEERRQERIKGGETKGDNIEEGNRPEKRKG